MPLLAMLCMATLPAASACPAEHSDGSSPSPNGQGDNALGSVVAARVAPHPCSGDKVHVACHKAVGVSTAICFPGLEWKPNNSFFLELLSPRDSVELLPKSKSCSRRQVIAHPQKEVSQRLVSQRTGRDQGFLSFVPPAL